MATFCVFTIFLLSSPTSLNSQIVNCKGSTMSTCSCPSTSGETCTLDCDNTDICKESRLDCRPGDACKIQCTAVAACSSGTTINAGTATDVTIICSGEDACKSNINIQCGTGNCRLYCSHQKGCIDWGSIDVSLSSSFQCIGYCPSNIPSKFGIIPSISPTKFPTSKIPTMRPISTTKNNKIIPTYNNNINQPTGAPFTYFVIGPNDRNITDTDLSDKQTNIFNVFDMVIWVYILIILGICIACAVLIHLYRTLCRKRRKNIRETGHKHTISTSISDDLIKGGRKDVIRPPGINDEDDAQSGTESYNSNEEQQQHIGFDNKESVSVTVPLNQSKSATPPVLPCTIATYGESGGQLINNDKNEVENEDEKQCK